MWSFIGPLKTIFVLLWWKWGVPAARVCHVHLVTLIIYQSFSSVCRYLPGKTCLQSFDKWWKLVYVPLMAFTAEACFTERPCFFFFCWKFGTHTCLGQWKGDKSWKMGNGQTGAKPGGQNHLTKQFNWGISWPTTAGEAPWWHCSAWAGFWNCMVWSQP